MREDVADHTARSPNTDALHQVRLQIDLVAPTLPRVIINGVEISALASKQKRFMILLGLALHASVSDSQFAALTELGESNWQLVLLLREDLECALIKTLGAHAGKLIPAAARGSFACKLDVSRAGITINRIVETYEPPCCRRLVQSYREACNSFRGHPCSDEELVERVIKREGLSKLCRRLRDAESEEIVFERMLARRGWQWQPALGFRQDWEHMKRILLMARQRLKTPREPPQIRKDGFSHDTGRTKRDDHT